MPTLTHFAHDIIPGDELNFASVDRLDARRWTSAAHASSTPSSVSVSRL